MGKPIDLTGQAFQRLTVLFAAPRCKGRRRWLCVCVCGNETTVEHSNLLQGFTGSCGCIRRESSPAYRHGGKKNHPGEYDTWKHIRSRCLRPGDKQFIDYGGRGVTLCEGWMSFEDFYRDLGSRPTPAHSIDRKDNDGGYWCGHCEECVANARLANCHWATPKEQANNRRSSRLITAFNRTQTAAQWAEETKLRYATLLYRLRHLKGRTVEEALTASVSDGGHGPTPREIRLL